MPGGAAAELLAERSGLAIIDFTGPVTPPTDAVRELAAIGVLLAVSLVEPIMQVFASGATLGSDRDGAGSEP